eukprot:TRINITY_DN7395_c0_g1_i1.p1 TRINITY_DN7395_c0_g1~~TRINITY_DN7395_c0_g1_i1.p1  ORF type:complete len:281 (-),score=42.18 TRINITY_DN7395_c0_g1_i1:140-949(-)
MTKSKTGVGLLALASFISFVLLAPSVLFAVHAPPAALKPADAVRRTLFCVNLAGFGQKLNGRGRTAACHANPVAVCETSLGTFKIQLLLEQMPVTSSNFIDLAKKGFYDGLHFHRVIPEFMCQFGCPNTRNLLEAGLHGTGGPPAGSEFEVLDGSGRTITRTQNYGDNPRGNIPDEFTYEIPNDRGTVNMANTGYPNSGSSQISINVENNEFLNFWDKQTDSAHPVFGYVVEGMEVVDQISKAKTGARDSPATPIRMLKVDIVDADAES